MKYQVTYTIETDMPQGHVEKMAGATDLMSHLRKIFGGGVTHVLFEVDEPVPEHTVELQDATGMKVCDITVEQLLTHLGVGDDISKRTRELERKIYDRTMAVFNELAQLTDNDMRNRCERPEFMESAKDLDDFANRFSFAFEHASKDAKFMVLWAWVGGR